jgi:hypothetical protein
MKLTLNEVKRTRVNIRTLNPNDKNIGGYLIKLKHRTRVKDEKLAILEAIGTGQVLRLKIKDITSESPGKFQYYIKTKVLIPGIQNYNKLRKAINGDY